MEIKVFDHIEQIDPQQWDRLITDVNYFHLHVSLKVLEKAKVEDSVLQYVCFYQDEVLVGSAVLSYFKINLSLFIGDNGLVRFINRVRPNFFRIKVLFCGTPVSAGHKNLYFQSADHERTGLKLLSAYMDTYCKKNKIQYSVFKEFTEDGSQLLETEIQHYGYFRGFSMPNCTLDLPYASYQEYLDNLKHGYRRQIRSSLKKIKMHEPIAGQASDSDFRFVVRPAKELDPVLFYDLYLHVMERAKVKLETLNLEFFTELFRSEKGDLKALELYHKDALLGSFIFSLWNDILIFLWTGKESEKDAYDAYQNLMQAMIQYAIDTGKKRIIQGQTSYYPKMKVGGQIEELYLFFRCQKPFKHKLLKSMTNVLFPPLKMNTLYAFK